MKYKEEVQPKKKFTREDFKKDVSEAVEPLLKKAPKAPKMPNAAKAKGNGYASMSAAALRKLLNDKKKALLVKSGFPDGAIPRSKAAMISLCKKLKRKRW